MVSSGKNKGSSGVVTKAEATRALWGRRIIATAALMSLLAVGSTAVGATGTAVNSMASAAELETATAQTGIAALDESYEQYQSASADSLLDVQNAASGVALKNATYSPDGPIVTELADGRFVQRTPNEDITTSLNAEGAYSHPGLNTTYNCAYLQADARGCNSCHDDLAALLNTADYGHTDLSNNMGIDIDVQMCIDCHEVGDGYQTTYYDLGTIIHSIHRDVDGADCLSCHNYTEDGEGFTMWDVSKHTLMRGITQVEELEGDFVWNQDVVVDQDSVFNWQWYSIGSDFLRNQRETDGDERDTSIYDSWTISLGGCVNQEVTYTISELLEQAPIETIPITMQCTYNPTGGPYIANVEATGIPLDWLIEQAGGFTDDAYGLYSISSDGNMNSMEVASLEGKDALIVLAINGETLQWDQGFPAMLWVGGTGAPINCKELSDIQVVDSSDEGIWEYIGWTDDGEYYYNKPNVGIMGTPEGLCIQAGEPYTFKGYASAFDQPITAIQFSMDGGQTWIEYDTSDSDVNRWVYWEFTWTPEADVDTAYVLMVRSVAADGTITADPVEVMVNTKSDLDTFAELIRANEGTTDGLADNQAVLVNDKTDPEGAPGTILKDPQTYADNLSEEDGKHANFDLLVGPADATTYSASDQPDEGLASSASND